ncbi:MAG: rod shape-determining protein MreC [Magnetococcales bacterium]|nr:rod shape-determining protein MreC [Magnetococcales bacterium]
MRSSSNMDAILVFLRQYRNEVFAIFLLLGALTLMLTVRSSVDGYRDVRGAVMGVVGPVQQVLLSPLEVWRGVTGRVSELVRLDDDNRHLRTELDGLKPRIYQLEELLQENRRLRALLNMPAVPNYRTMAARVVGNSSSAFSRSFLISAGSSDGVSDRVAVVGAEGLLGRVVQVSPQSSLVLSLLDINSRVPVLVQRSRVRAIAAGLNGRYLSLAFVPKGSDIRIGDKMITSGTGGIFPKGLLLGRVISVKPQDMGLFLHILVEPEADLDRIEEVRLLLNATMDVSSSEQIFNTP